jgi:hypothetical protein
MLSALLKFCEKKIKTQTGSHSRKCQTVTATPAEPGVLLVAIARPGPQKTGPKQLPRPGDWSNSCPKSLEGNLSSNLDDARIVAVEHLAKACVVDP